MSGATPAGSPDAVLPVTRRKLLILIPARSTPLGASSAAIWRSIQTPSGKPGRPFRAAAPSPLPEPEGRSIVYHGSSPLSEGAFNPFRRATKWLAPGFLADVNLWPGCGDLWLRAGR